MYINYDCDDLDQCYGKVSIGCVCSKLLKCQQRSPTIARFLLNYKGKPTLWWQKSFQKSCHRMCLYFTGTVGSADASENVDWNSYTGMYIKTEFFFSFF